MADTDSEEKWFVFYTQFKHEKTAHHALSKRGILSYLPLIKKLKVWSDRKKWVDEPMFPCYNFVKTNEAGIYSVLNENGIVKCVTFAGQRATLRDSEVDLLKKLELHQNEIEVVHDAPTPGDKVKILSGSFAGHEGYIVEQGKGNKMILLLELFGVSVLTTFNFVEVRKI